MFTAERVVTLSLATSEVVPVCFPFVGVCLSTQKLSEPFEILSSYFYGSKMAVRPGRQTPLIYNGFAEMTVP